MNGGIVQGISETFRLIRDLDIMSSLSGDGA